MTRKSTSTEAYIATKEYRTTQRWKVLNYLFATPRPLTSAMVQNGTGMLALSSVQARLKELEDFGLVFVRRQDQKSRAGQPAVSYRISDRGRVLMRNENYSKYLMGLMSKRYNILTEVRARDLADLKEHWDITMNKRGDEIALGIMDKAGLL